MVKSPFISVIIDNYNYARFLPEAINSVLAQTFTDYEIIVVDDDSTDHSREIIESYGDKIQTIFLEKNGGQGAAFNAGFAQSRGEIICFLDADDLYLPDKLAEVAKAALANPDAILIYHRGHAVSEDLELIDVPFPKKLFNGNICKQIVGLSESSFPPTSFLSLRRAFLSKIFPMNPFLTRIDADFPLQMLAGILGEVVAIPEALGLYRLHGDNWFNNTDTIWLTLDALKQLMRRTERSFYFINNKLAEIGSHARLQLIHNRFHLRNLFIFNEASWWQYLRCTLTHPHFYSLKDRWEYFIFGIKRYQQFNSLRIEAKK